ncbi:tetratricopeptide repeat-containing sensor histidine kinase [Xanthocytophaga flava]|uniref:tetratricopeptide repeat-containing sensor histidine kinase n=1 Tax=Xanthocytophaga flava TaxID=3048013 RepID=UPI0028D3E79A|nr:tetratricopeptide repeat-containing sensor histidine kinase [Xanthocytophaga flavus]MDJ1471819.1 tetratricopeptide repeat-containing sensor histidine kinase [Xanthocytophaga flavus]
MKIYSEIRVFYLIAFFFVGVVDSLVAQHQAIDTTISELARTTPTTYRTTYRKLENNLRLAADQLSDEELISILGKIQNATRHLSFKGPLAAGYRMEAVIYELTNHVSQALDAAVRACRLARSYHLPVELADDLAQTGNVYNSLDQADSSLKYYLNALNIYASTKQQLSQGRILYRIGNLFYHTKQEKLSLSYLQKALDISADSLDSRSHISLLNTIGLIYRNQKQYTKAINYNKQSLKLAEEVKDSAWIGINYGNIGHIYELKHNYTTALKYYQANLELSRKFMIWGDVVTTMSRVSQIYTKEQKYAQAKQVLANARLLAMREKEYDDLIEVYQSYVDCYQHANQFDSAFYYQQLYYQVKDSLGRQSFNTEVEHIRVSFEFDKKQGEIELLKKNNAVITASEQKKESWLLASSFLLVCTTLFAGLLYRSNHQKNKANRLLITQQRELFEKNEEINRQNEEILDLNNHLEESVAERTEELQIAHDNLVKQNQNLEQFTYIISHNLRAPIAQIMGLVGIFSESQQNGSATPQMLEYLNRSASNLDMIVNDLNDILLMRNQADAVREPVHLDEVAQTVLESLKGPIANTQAQVLTDFSDVQVITAIRSYLTSILYNLLSNAIKYRSPDRSLIVTIQTLQVDKYVCVSVQDNGLGMDLTKNDPKKLFKLYHRMHFHTEGKGMGLFIVKEQVDAMNGKIEVDSEPNKGTTFRIYLPS